MNIASIVNSRFIIFRDLKLLGMNLVSFRYLFIYEYMYIYLCSILLGAEWVGKVGFVQSASNILDVRTEPAINVGSVTVLRAGEVCFVTKVDILFFFFTWKQNVLFFLLHENKSEQP